MRSVTLSSLYLLPLVVSALPSVRRDSANTVAVPFTKRTTYTENAISARQVNAAITPNDLTIYTVEVKIGTPAQTFELILDTGSSDIWAYAPESSTSCSDCTENYFDYTKSTSQQPVNNYGVFNITYGTPNSGVLGFYASDIVSVGGASVRQTLGVVTRASANDPPNGIFGIGPGKNEASYARGFGAFPTFTDSLKEAGLIKTTSYSIFLNSITATDTAKGSILFGGTDSSKYTGNLVAFPVVVPAPNGQITLDIALPGISYDLGKGAVAVPAAPSTYTVLLDTGTSITRLPTTQFAPIARAVGAQLVQSIAAYVVNCTLAQQTGGVDLAFSSSYGKLNINVPWKQLAIEQPGLPAGVCVFGLLPETQSDARGLYIFGDTFLRSTYMYFDLENAAISLAQAKYDH